MTKKLMRNMMVLVLALSMVLGCMTGFVRNTSVQVAADVPDPEVHVYYGFENIRTKARFDEIAAASDPEKRVIIFVPSTLGIDFSVDPALPVIPAGSAKLYVTDYSNGRTDPDLAVSGVSIGNRYCNVDSPINRNSSLVIAKVAVIASATGFDTCVAGGLMLGDMTITEDRKDVDIYSNNIILNDNRFVYYGCNGGGVYERKCPGNAVLYKETTVHASDFTAMLKPGVADKADVSGNISLTKSDIQLSFTLNGKNYLVPENLVDSDYDLGTDKQVNLSASDGAFDDIITVKFSGQSEIPVKVHQHSWKITLDEKNGKLTAQCDNVPCPVQDVPYIAISVRQGTTETDIEGNEVYVPANVSDLAGDGRKLPAILSDMNVSWNYVAGGSAVKYESLSGDVLADPYTSPVKKGNYRGVVFIQSNDGTAYELVKEFSVNAKGEINEGTDHVHSWKYTLDNGTIKCECISNVGTCPSKDTYQVSNEIGSGEFGGTDDGDYSGVSITYAGNKENGITPEELGLDEPVVEYYVCQTEADGSYKSDSTGYARGTAVKDSQGNFVAPTKAGSYVMVTKFTNPDGTEVKIERPFTLYADESGSGKFSVDTPYQYVYSGTGIDYNHGFLTFTQAQFNAATDGDKKAFENYAKQFVQINDAEATRDPLYNYAMDANGKKVSDIYIDMFTETLVKSGEFASKKIVAYKLTKTGKWETGELTNEIIQKAFDKSATAISITFDAVTDGKPTGAVYTLTAVERRPNADMLKVDYFICRDVTGSTNGQFILTINNKAVYDAASKYDVSVASADDSKNVASFGWGVWPYQGGVWVPDATVTADSSGKETIKTAKYTFFVRNKAKLNSTGTRFTPASKVKKLSVSSVQKPLTIKADYKKEVLKVKKGALVLFSNQMINPKNADFEAEIKDIDTYKYAAKDAENKDIELLFADYVKTDNVKASDYENLFVDYADSRKAGISIAAYLEAGKRNVVKLWTEATKSKPASAVQTISLAKRGQLITSGTGVANAEANGLKVSESGKLALTKVKLGEGDSALTLDYEIKTEKNGKVSWKTSITAPKPAELTDTMKVTTEDKTVDDVACLKVEYEIRIKSSVKAGQENDTTFASGEVAYLLITYYDSALGEGSTRKVAIKSVEVNKTKQLVEPEEGSTT